MLARDLDLGEQRNLVGMRVSIAPRGPAYEKGIVRKLVDDPDEGLVLNVNSVQERQIF